MKLVATLVAALVVAVPAGAAPSDGGAIKSVVVAVDRSQSMRGKSLADAIEAARGFVSAKSTADEIEVIEFGKRAATLTHWSADSAGADAALASLVADSSSGTALWDAVVLGAKTLAGQPASGRVIVVLSDGRDVTSRATMDDAITAARQADVAVYPIGIAGPDYTPAPLRELASTTGGSYHEAGSSAELAGIYASVGRELHPPSIWQAAWMPFVLSLFVGLLVLVACGFWFSARKGRWVRSRLEPHLDQVKRSAKKTRFRKRRDLIRSIVMATERAFANVKQFRALQKLIERADLPLRAAELFYMCIGSGVVAGILFTIAFSSPLLSVGAALAGGWIPVLFVKFKASARLRAFDNQLADILITMSASLKAGHSFRHAVQAVVDEAAEPSAKEFSRVLSETQLGRPMDQALGDLAERVGSKNLTFVITAVTIQRQVGGSLSGLFDMVAETVRQRQQFMRKVRSLTAMGRMSAYALVGLPLFMAATITLLNPGYMAPLYNTSTGHMLIGLGLGMLATGSFILKRMVSFKG